MFTLPHNRSIHPQVNLEAQEAQTRRSMVLSANIFPAVQMITWTLKVSKVPHTSPQHAYPLHTCLITWTLKVGEAGPPDAFLHTHSPGHHPHTQVYPLCINTLDLFLMSGPILEAELLAGSSN